MENWFERTQLLIGARRLEKLNNSHVLVVGLGGVGAYSAECLCRAGIGQMTIVDGDIIHASNKNRQLIALDSTMGGRKAEIVGQRLLDINPKLKLTILDEYLCDDRLSEIVSLPYDYVVDAIDTLSPKVFLIIEALKAQHRLVSSMGSGGKLDPSLVRVGDISQSYSCRLAYMVRKRLHRQGVKTGFTVVFSPEPVPGDAIIQVNGEANKLTTVGTISYMPPIFGCMLASVVIRDLISIA
ncbi:MAG TPA: tRNA threonylcarbamoyladenosine dehydratase [Bacteroidales bacterium]|nr:MAG: tRNA threonylcarbamoyladenosine dehydratase [Bacteroidetes bacterium GWE2_42_24]OFY30433.1 MAG: tRNA threonylcarbamoyladenosine dehydratase [Bacteroidetes bacterium GWF2_43_11]HAQ65893.1 tRNA threonylcarbamoyladenosine dehydratase [Bacteroidales bacterium]HBZ65298.1 tRNA threonylcarbamoyladenosine dehydratase [Bacteroidales bacterium]